MNQRIHFIGIGGSGMGPLAKIFIEMGWEVRGSDIQESETTQYLAKLGATISIGHASKNVVGADRVVYSSAIPKSNPEYCEAIKQDLKLYHRSELLAELINERRGIAVGGAHGKTTITSMIAWILVENELDPIVLIGAKFKPFGPGAKFGNGSIVVAEADESDRSFLHYRPEVAIVTSIEADHLENYNNNFSELVDTYQQFLANVKSDGLVVLGIDDSEVRKIMPNYSAALTYGFSEDALWKAEIISVKENCTNFIVYHAGKKFGDFHLKVPGKHNVSNAIAAIAVSAKMGLKAAEISKHLATYSGAHRRFEIVSRKDDIIIVDDYAHHPTEIMATLKAAREGWRQSRIIAVFQPHRYTRTKSLFKEFTEAFFDADIVILTDIYAPPPEKPLPGISSEIMAEKIKEQGQEVYLIRNREDVSEFLYNKLQTHDLVITMGAGSIWKSAQELATKFNQTN